MKSINIVSNEYYIVFLIKQFFNLKQKFILLKKLMYVFKYSVLLCL